MCARILLGGSIGIYCTHGRSADRYILVRSTRIALDAKAEMEE